MASLHAIQPSAQKPLFSVKQIDAHFPDFGAVALNGKWTYLVSNTIRFDHSAPYAIRISRPERDELGVLLEKIITAGQCSQLFVEELQLNELELKRIKNLCQQYQVVLINLYTQLPLSSNVIQGPWS